MPPVPVQVMSFIFDGRYGYGRLIFADVERGLAATIAGAARHLVIPALQATVRWDVEDVALLRQHVEFNFADIELRFLIGELDPFFFCADECALRTEDATRPIGVDAGLRR